MPNAIMRQRMHEPEDPSEFDDSLPRETAAKLRGVNNEAYYFWIDVMTNIWF